MGLRRGHFASRHRPATDLHDNLRAGFAMTRPPHPNLFKAVASHPVHDEAIWREQLDDRSIYHELKRPNPGVELLFRQLGL